MARFADLDARGDHRQGYVNQRQVSPGALT
jgi:hypothetical protein